MPRFSTEQISMEILTQAGHAKKLLDEILTDLAGESVTKATIDEKLQASHNYLVEAHKRQNEIIKYLDQAEYSMLLTHAQDTLMNTETIQFMTEKFNEIYFKSKK